MSYFISLLFVALGILFGALDSSYRSVSLSELRQRAREQNETAKRLYELMVYGSEVSVLLRLLSLVSVAVASAFLFQHTPVTLAVVLSLLALWLVVVVSWSVELATVESFAIFIAPALASVIRNTRAVLRGIAKTVPSKEVLNSRSIYTTDDVINFLRKVGESNNNGHPDEMTFLEHVAKYVDMQVGDIMVPIKSTKTVRADESVGPVLLEELHNSGFTQFPVTENNKKDFVGVLNLSDALSAKQGGVVREVMKQGCLYLSDEFSLAQAFDAFFKTKQYIYLVVDRFESVVGLVTIGDVIRSVLGTPVVSDFDQYDQPTAVATYRPVYAEEEAPELDDLSEVVE